MPWCLIEVFEPQRSKYKIDFKSTRSNQEDSIKNWNWKWRNLSPSVLGSVIKSTDPPSKDAIITEVSIYFEISS